MNPEADSRYHLLPALYRIRDVQEGEPLTEPLNGDRFEEFCRHRQETAELADATRDARVTFVPQCVQAMWQEWAGRTAPSWLADHVGRLRARYCVSVPAVKHG